MFRFYPESVKPLKKTSLDDSYYLNWNRVEFEKKIEKKV